MTALTFDKNIFATLVWDGGDEVHIPEALGTPRSDQMRGTPAERVSELAGRTCYDSVGAAKSRPSFDTTETILDVNEYKERPVQGYHTHIKQVKHSSVWGHFHYTVEINIPPANWMHAVLSLFNRPGVYVHVAPMPEYCRVRLTLNLRAAYEWEMHTPEFANPTVDLMLQHIVKFVGADLAPHIIEPTASGRPHYWEFSHVQPARNEERWISLFMSGSRGFSHEMVRHGYRTGISQRSTRFCDETHTPWVEHPLITYWWYVTQRHITRFDDPRSHRLAEHMDRWKVSRDLTVRASQQFYSDTVDELQKFLVERGVDAGTARKQARGAARGYLGNGLTTEIVFSANVTQWRWMLSQRATAAADGEIRVLHAGAEEHVLKALRQSRYAHRFDDMELVDSPDGIGMVVQQKAS